MGRKGGGRRLLGARILRGTERAPAMEGGGARGPDTPREDDAAHRGFCRRRDTDECLATNFRPHRARVRLRGNRTLCTLALCLKKTNGFLQRALLQP